MAKKEHQAATTKEMQVFFTDRVDIVKNFWKTLYKIEKREEPYRIITYTGDGGIGKTELLKKLESELIRIHKEQEVKGGRTIVESEDKEFREEFSRNYIPIRFDFEETLDIVEILSYWRVIIGKKLEDMKFPIFDYAIAKYEDLMFKEVKAKAKKEQSGGVAENISTIVSWFTGVDVYQAGTTLKELLRAISEKVKKEDPAIGEWYSEIDIADEDYIKKRIAVYFALDIDSTLNPTRGDNCFVFLLDTFELLQYDEKYIVMKHILELIEEEDTDDAVWVIAGRNNIPIKNQRHENIVVGNFSETDAAYYLQEKRGVKEQEVIDKIFKLSDGSPIFLQIGADTYNNMSEEERVNASDAVYGIDREELIKRYMKYLNERDKDLLYMMSSMMHWGKEDFKFVCNKVYNNNWSQYEGNYNKIIETPMIEKLEGKERRFLHRVVRNSIYTDPQYPEENRANTWDAIVELYRQRITEEPMELIYYKNRLIEILTRAVEINETMTEEQEDAVLSIISNSAYDLKSYGYNNIDEYVVALEEYMAIAVNPEKVESRISNLLSVIGKESEVTDRAEKNLERKIAEFGEESPQLLPYLRRLASQYMFNRNSNKEIRLREKIVKLVYADPEKDIVDRLRTKEDLINAYNTLGNAKKTESVAESMLDEINNVLTCGDLGEEQEDRVVGVLLNLNRFVKGIERRIEAVLNIVVEGRKNKYGEMDKRTLSSLWRLADFYEDISQKDSLAEVVAEIERIVFAKPFDYEGNLRNLRRLRRLFYRNPEKQKEITESIMEYIREEKPDDIETLISEKNMYMSNLCDVKDFNGIIRENDEIVRMTETIYKDEPERIFDARSRILGYSYRFNIKDYIDVESAISDLEEFVLSHRSIGADWAAGKLSGLSSYAVDIIKNYDRAVELLNRAIAVSIEQYGDRHEAVFRKKRSLSDLHNRIGNKEDAWKLLDEVVEGRKALIGNNEEALLDLIRTTRRDYINVGRIEDAEKAYIEGAERAKAYYGEGDPKALKFIEDLASFYSDEETMIGKAIPIYEELVSLTKENDAENKKEILRRSGDLALCYSKKGRKEDAIKVLKEVIEDYKRSGGDFDLQLARRVESLADLLDEMGRTDEAIRLMEEAVDSSRKKHGNVYRTRVLLLKLADLYSKVDLEKCEKIRKEVDELKEKARS